VLDSEDRWHGRRAAREGVQSLAHADPNLGNLVISTMLSDAEPARDGIAFLRSLRLINRSGDFCCVGTSEQDTVG